MGGDFKVSLLTKTPLPNIPPKYQTSSERWSLSSITFPPGKNSRMLARRPNTARGMRVPPRHLAQLPVHMPQTWDGGVWSSPSAAFLAGSLQSCWPQSRNNCLQINSYFGAEKQNQPVSCVLELLQLLKCSRTSMVMVIYILSDLKLVFLPPCTLINKITFIAIILPWRPITSVNNPPAQTRHSTLLQSNLGLEQTASGPTAPLI